MRSRRLVRGVTLIEVLTASSISVLVVFGVISTLLMGMSAWAKGEGRINAEMGSQKTVKMIAGELREAMAVTVDGDGRGLSYQLPAKDGSGNFTSPATWDGVTKRIQFRSTGEGRGTIEMGTLGGTMRPLTTRVLVTDPGTNSTYRFFTAGAGTVTREVDFRVVLDMPTTKTERVQSTSREVIYLRNVPTTSN
ncbi:MAG: hypothetical protein K8R88_09235 [Armatimonadetes bacterium]|nr:hypothetical protein [Armatimonadota bacterium]